MASVTGTGRASVEALYQLAGDSKVDLPGDETIRVYRSSAPDRPAISHRGEMAEAEPALPGWTFPSMISSK
jgi:hypothetical protein